MGKMFAWLSLPQPTVNEDNIVQHQNKDPRYLRKNEEKVRMVKKEKMEKMVTKMVNELDCLVHLSPPTANVIAPTARITNPPQHCTFEMYKPCTECCGVWCLE